MHKLILPLLFSLISVSATAQSFDRREISINGFRNPSIGAEYRFGYLSAHAGYYPTAFRSGENTSFVKVGVTAWFLPVDTAEFPSSFYAGASYMRGFNREYTNTNALGMEVGFRWNVWAGLNVRLGAIAVVAQGHDTKFNPAPGISYSFPIN